MPGGGGGALQFGGMLFFAIMVLGFLRKKAGNVVARKQYPSLADKLGLTYKSAPYKDGVGRLEGSYQGFRVIVDPDDQRRIFVKFATSPPVELHSYVHNKRPQNGQVSFRPPSGVLAAQFKTAHATPALVEALNGNEEIIGQLKPLKFLRPLKALSVTSSGIVAKFDYGNPPFIPADIVEDVLPRLIALASIFEKPE